MKHFLIVISLLVAALPYLNAQSAQVAGVVRDDLGAVQPRAGVQLLSSGRNKHVLKTDVNGQYQFDQLPAGSYEFSVTATCFKVYKKTLTLESTSMVTLDVKLTRAGTSCVGID
jgi:hypothetical protein